MDRTPPQTDEAARRQAEDQLAISEERHRLLAENANDVDLDDVARRTHHLREPRRGADARLHAGGGDAAAARRDRAARLGRHHPALLPGAGGRPRGRTPAKQFHGELEYYCKDGSTVWTEVQVIPHLGPDGEVVEILGVTRDISERKRAEQEIRRLNDELEERVLQRTAQLEEANRELEAFVYSASHDLRAPLRAIDGFSQMVAEDAAERLEPVDEEHLQRVRAAAQRMGALIDHLLALSGSSQADLVYETVDVSEMATSILDELRLRDPQRAVESVVQPGLVAEADATLLHLILANLLDNAWKFTGKHETARIEVGADDAGKERAYFVRDDGCGFDGAAAERIFGAFWRLHTSDEFEGDGIGLATVKRLVAKHGGRVWAAAEAGKGATFFFTLPEPAPGA